MKGFQTEKILFILCKQVSLLMQSLLFSFDNFFQTQPVPNPLSYYLHQSPELFHKFETLSNHFIELIAPWFILLTRRMCIAGGVLQIFFQVSVNSVFQIKRILEKVIFAIPACEILFLQVTSILIEKELPSVTLFTIFIRSVFPSCTSWNQKILDFLFGVDFLFAVWYYYLNTLSSSGSRNIFSVVVKFLKTFKRPESNYDLNSKESFEIDFFAVLLPVVRF